MDSVVHFEIPADDIERAQEFYSRAFGWTMRVMEEYKYMVITTTPSDEQGVPQQAGSINGGMPKRGNGIHHTTITIRVGDIEARLRQIEVLGGKTVTSKTPVADMGFTAYFEDTEGNVLGLWQDAV
jgi:uncharacterized protein